MKTKLFLIALFSIAISTIVSCSQKQYDDYVNTLRPSAYPLITIDPYMSLWSFSDNLNATEVRHWTGREEPLQARLRVDGEVYRIMGKPVGKMTMIVPTAKYEKWDARYITGQAPADNWYAEDFDDSKWNVGKGGFGAENKTTTGTKWDEIGDIYLRRTFTLDDVSKDLVLECSHDESYELYINGQLAISSNSYTEFYETVEIPSLLKPGKNVVACHCHNEYGAACIDFGFLSFLGDDNEQIAEQKSVNVLPTRTIYNFKCGAVDLEMVFMAPLIMDDLDIMSRPVNYIAYNVSSNDGNKHDVQFMMTAAANLVVDSDPEPVFMEIGKEKGINFVKSGTVEQRILAKKGDNVRIDWGHLYLASKDGHMGILNPKDAVESFRANGDIAETESSVRTDNYSIDPISSVFTNNLGFIDNSHNFMMIAYDDIYSVQYFWQNLRPYWNRSGNKDIFGEIASAATQYESLCQKCQNFDKELMQKAETIGGRKYAELCAVAYRQSISAHKLVESPQGELLFLSKENFSNGSIGTVDVTYPSAPLFLHYNPELAKGLLNHIFYFSESGRWTKPFAAHDVGTYPIANGQTYGGDMPVEESGNMLILTAAIAKAEGNAEYARKHWQTLTSWAEYLVQFGLDPEEQLCTDDFAGHFAHNTNLSIKAILGLASYAKLAEQLGYVETSTSYMSQAKEMASKWKEMADDGDHYRLTFDKPGTWSQKYNLVWDRLLDINIFDPSISQTEIAYYLTKINKYGLPLDSRKTYTKLDWIIWTATMADNSSDFETLISPIWDFENSTLERIPMSDWVETVEAKSVGFRARSVVGGYFIPFLK